MQIFAIAALCDSGPECERHCSLLVLVVVTCETAAGAGVVVIGGRAQDTSDTDRA